MSLSGLFGRRGSAPVARERLQILLEYERGLNQSDLVATLRDEILAAVSKYVTVEPEKVQVKVDRGDAVSMLEVDIEIPNPLGRRQVAGSGAQS
jgi:cell division topological specificity factor